jgi:hypothetical protein
VLGVLIFHLEISNAKSLSALKPFVFSVKQIEKKFNKLDNAIGPIDLETLLKEDNVKDKQEKKSFERLCPTYFKLGKCLAGEACGFAHSVEEFGRTYYPQGRRE